MNDFLQLVNARQSDRAYDKSRLVEADKLERILEAGRLAPSACNAQPWRFVVVTDPSLAEKVGNAARNLAPGDRRGRGDGSTRYGIRYRGWRRGRECIYRLQLEYGSGRRGDEELELRAERGSASLVPYPGEEEPGYREGNDNRYG